MRLSDWPLPYVRLSCEFCEREGKLATEKLIGWFGPDADMFTVREELAKPRCKKTNPKDICKSKLTDALLVDAILEPDIAKVLKKDLLPEAREWRKKLGIKIDEFDGSKGSEE
jgi:hypothetical protein